MRRLDEPLRVAIAGRSKAGKSTLLNALVGERLAATDAGECTRIVTWYRHALGYRVIAELRPRGRAELAFRRSDGALEIDLGGLRSRRSSGSRSAGRREAGRADADRHARVCGSTDEAPPRGRRSALLDEDGDRPGEADAVIYLMRHLHRSDARFLEAFIDRSIAHASPINAIVVLSRADEIGAARPDALDSARAVAARYAADRRVRELASGVVPVAGLIAETGATLREEQFGWLREIAGSMPERRRDALLRSVDRFRDAERNPLGEEIREELLDRLGLFGLRLAVGLIADGRASAARRSCRRPSSSGPGSASSQRVLAERYGARGQSLKARSALAALRAIGDELDRRAVPGAADAWWRSTGSRHRPGELALLRLLHLVLAGAVELGADERAEIERLCAVRPRCRADRARRGRLGHGGPCRRAGRHRALADARRATR